MQRNYIKGEKYCYRKDGRAMTILVAIESNIDKNCKYNTKIILYLGAPIISYCLLNMQV